MERITNNPFDAAASTLAARLQATGVAGARVDLYDGSDPDEVREIVRQRGPAVMIRAVGAKAAPGEGPLSADCADVQVQILGAAKPAATRTAWSYAWAAYAALRNTDGGVSWLSEGLRFAAAQIEDETKDCLIVSITMAAHVDLGEWSAA